MAKSAYTCFVGLPLEKKQRLREYQLALMFREIRDVGNSLELVIIAFDPRLSSDIKDWLMVRINTFIQQQGIHTPVKVGHTEMHVSEFIRRLSSVGVIPHTCLEVYDTPNETRKESPE